MRQRGITILTVIILLVVPVTLCAWGFLLPACFTETFMGELPVKVRLLDETEGRRIIVVGGSAAAFGIDSEIIHQEMEDYSVVNFGMYAGLGTEAMLNLSRKSLHEGDIVIVMPEQQEQSLTDYFGAEYFWQAADGNFHLLWRLSDDERMRAVGAFPAFAAEKFRYVNSGKMPEPDGVYRKGTFADNGDIREGVAVENRMPGGYDVNTPIRFETGMVSREFADAMNAYTAEAVRCGAAVYYHFSPMNEKAFEFREGADASDEMETYTNYLAGCLTCSILGDPRDSILDAEYFFDTNFHLTDAGRAVFTRQLVRDLKAELGDFSKTEGSDMVEAEAAEPGKPSSDNTIAETAADNIFRYTIRDGAVVLTGLTDFGAEETAIAIPSEIEGYPVEMIAASAFAHRTRVEKITIADSVRMIEDYAFDGCSSLREIVMESGEPEKCMVGRHLLDGTAANVIVPDGALSAYRLNYNWSVWAERIDSE